MMKKILLGFASMFVLGGCSFSRDTPAPVVNVTAPPASAAALVNPASVAKPQTVPAASTTTINKIDNSDDGEVTQVPTKATAKKAASAASSSSSSAAGDATTIGGIAWLTPTAGTIVQPYSVAAKGVDVSGKEGQSIVAAAAGKVVYSGSGLKGYGNLIIIKHQDNYLTAYSHNKQNLVKEGQQVKRGQKIAELGKTDSDKPILHFELRLNGKPLNPSKLFNQ